MLGGALVACSDDDEAVEDTVRPEILSATINDEDHDIVVTSGSTMHFDAQLSDNEELRELKVDIHDMFDGHDHGKVSNKWSEVRIIPLSGKTQTVHEDFSVPSGLAAGPYHVILRVLDAEGNESEFMELEFDMSNGSEPTFSVLQPDFSTEVHVNKGDSLLIEGTVNDDIDLDEVELTIKEEHDDHHHHKKGEEYLVEIKQELPGANDQSFDLSNFKIGIPAAAETAHYKLEIKAKDNEGNYAKFKAEIHIM